MASNIPLLKDIVHKYSQISDLYNMLHAATLSGCVIIEVSTIKTRSIIIICSECLLFVLLC